MKRMTALICAVLCTAMLFSSCTGMKNDVKGVTDDMATMASEMKDNLDKMVENGTVNDGDGFIDEDKSKDDDRSKLSTEYVTDYTEDVTEYYDKDIIDGTTESTDASDFI